MHIILHVLPGIILHGPVHSWSMYVYERMNSWICQRVTNQCHPEATVMETYRVSTLFITIAAIVINRPFHTCALGTLAFCESEAGGDLVLIQTFFFSVGDYAEKILVCIRTKQPYLRKKGGRVLSKAMSTPASPPPTTVNRYVWHR